ncbi:polysaccharide pyruvyl transferase family protein [Aquibacillus saliphilus]|uniref:polysaccharide pyruvyl transferase family protein n=1 Tax=Aquibacillus saliphilus TaxID=1909422 RepID=UPI001CF0AEAE|nr:polysaccharide pyruvyl transferase family protein [Aquibacillus saliphilus]
MKKQLVIMGAFDRYNFGDLLFPIIIQEYINKYRLDVRKHYSEIVPVALEKKDLSDAGGLTTHAWKDLNPNTARDIIVAGGDVLGANTSGLYMDSLNSYNEHFIARVMRKILTNKYIENKAAEKFQVTNLLPYVPIQGLNNVDNIVYNSVSGSGLISGEIKKDDNKIIVDRLLKSKFVSIRDKNTHKAILNNGVTAKLAPDSASIVRELFPLEELETKITDDKIINLKGKDHIVFQFGLRKSKNHFDEIVSQIEEIASQGDNEIVLLPVGFATNHDDVIALRKISKKIKVPHTFFDELTIWEIMYIIGTAKFLFGTSLHANITAMSYNVPHIGLNKNIVKLDKYLETWGLEPLNKNIDFSEMSSFFFKNKNFDKTIIYQNSNKLIKLTHDNFNELFDNLLID